VELSPNGHVLADWRAGDQFIDGMRLKEAMLPDVARHISRLEVLDAYLEVVTEGRKL
jgi:hypothetical protein